MNHFSCLGLNRTGLVGLAPTDDSSVALVPLASLSPAPIRKPNRAQHVLVGYSSTRIIMEFTRWAVERSEFPTVEAIVRRFNVSRATAYRWRGELRDTYGLEQMPPNENSRASGVSVPANEVGG